MNHHYLVAFHSVMILFERLFMILHDSSNTPTLFFFYLINSI